MSVYTDMHEQEPRQKSPAHERRDVLFGKIIPYNIEYLNTKYQLDISPIIPESNEVHTYHEETVGSAGHTLELAPPAEVTIESQPSTPSDTEAQAINQVPASKEVLSHEAKIAALTANVRNAYQD